MKKKYRPDRIASYFYMEKKLLLAILFSGTICSLFMVMINVEQGRLLDTLFEKQGLYALLKQSLIFLATVTLIQLLRLMKRYDTRRFANRTTLHMRSIMFSQMIDEPLEKLEKTKSGDVITKILSDVDLCAEGMRKVMTEVFDTGMLIISYFTGLLMYDVKCTLLSCLCIPLASLLATLMKRFVEKKTSIYRKASSDHANMTMEQCANVLLYRSNSMEKRALNEYRNSLENLKKKAVFAAVLENALMPLYQMISMIGIIVVLIIGGRYVMEGNWSIGDFTAYIGIYVLLADKASKAAKVFNITQKAKVSWLRVKEYMKPELIIPQSIACTHVHEMKVEHLSFAYPNSDQMILKDITFTLKKGEMVGLCSPIAKGKSTLLLALLGEYPYEGEIYFDHKNAKEFKACQIMSYMGHDPYLMSDTIQENIEMGREGNMKKALEDASFEEDLKAMKEKEKTPAGSGGAALSNGQQQRIALARALFSPSDFLLLDDPFAALDEKTTWEVIRHLKEHKDQGLLVSTHKMQLMEMFDWIICLEENGSYQIGTHEELMRNCKTYQKLAKKEGVL